MNKSRIARSIAQLNSGWYSYGGYNAMAMLTIYYTNGDSSTYMAKVCMFTCKHAHSFYY